MEKYCNKHHEIVEEAGAEEILELTMGSGFTHLVYKVYKTSNGDLYRYVWGGQRTYLDDSIEFVKTSKNMAVLFAIEVFARIYLEKYLEEELNRLFEGHTIDVKKEIMRCSEENYYSDFLIPDYM